MLAVLCLGLLACAAVVLAVGALAVWRQSGQGPGSSQGPVDLPAPSEADKRCVTHMIEDDTPECFAAVYNACVDGRGDASRVPASIAADKSRVLRQLYNSQKPNFDGVPGDWSAVCVARPDKAGRGACSRVRPGSFRVWARGKGQADECVRGGGLFLKAHYNADGSIQGEYTGKVGHV